MTTEVQRRSKHDKPYGYSSIWGKSSGEKPKSKNLFPSWPKPFNAIDRITVMNCNEVVAMRVDFVTEIFAQMVFDAKVPSPTELFRRWAFGDIPCGKRIKNKFRLPHPSDVILKRQGRSIMAFAGGFLGTGLFAYAFAQTVFTAMSTWSSIAMVQAYCENPEARAIILNGNVRVTTPSQGVVVFYQTLYNGGAAVNPVTGFITPPNQAGPCAAWAYGHIFNESDTFTASVDVWIALPPEEKGEQVHFEIPPLGSASFHIMRGFHTPQTVAVGIDLLEWFPTLAGVQFFVDAFCADWSEDLEPARSMIDFGDPPRRTFCQALYADGTPLFPS